MQSSPNAKFMLTILVGILIVFGIMSIGSDYVESHRPVEVQLYNICVGASIPTSEKAAHLKDCEAKLKTLKGATYAEDNGETSETSAQ